MGWGADFIQLREKDMTGRELFDLTREAVGLSRNTPCRILVNGRIDVALAARAHGVHLPAAGILPADVRTHLPRGFLLGVSAHSLREARLAAEGGVDYLLVGPVFSTPSKMRYGKPMGLRSFARICSAIAAPVFGLGGIHVDEIPSVLGAGAVGIAGIRFFQEDLPYTLRDSLRAIPLGG